MCKQAFGKVVNVGNPEEVTMNHLANMIKKLVRSTSEIRHIPYDIAYAEGFEDMRRRVPEIKRAASLIGFNPKRSLHKILSDVIKSLK
jgi:UDP-glucose 4-epimerase